MKGKKTFLIGIAVAFVLPLSFYILAKSLGKDKLGMPAYYKGTERINSHDAMKLVRSGAFTPVKDLEARNQFGDLVSLHRDLQGKNLLINFIFLNCTSECPRLTTHMQMLQHAFRRTPMKRNDTTVQFISISVDPGRDSVAALRAYTKTHGVDENRWWFLTGDKKMIYDWARNELRLSVPAGDGGAEDFIHTKSMVLLDRDRYIRGYYNGLDTADLSRCAYDMGLLTMEKKH